MIERKIENQKEIKFYVKFASGRVVGKTTVHKIF